MTSIKPAAPVLLTALLVAGLAGPVLAHVGDQAGGQARPSSQTQALNQVGRAAAAPAAGAAGAAATLPNTVDGPAATAVATPAQPVAPAVSEAQAAEGALRAVIDQLRAGDIDERMFTPGVSAQLNPRLAEYSRVIRGYGQIQSIEARGASGGVGEFLVTFDTAATQWQLGLDAAGLIAAVRFREAPPESSEPTS